MTSVIPAVLCIDAEPNANSPEIGDVPWTGFTSFVDFIDGLRSQLAERSGVEPHFSWYFRLDPAVDKCFGRSDFIAHRHAPEVERVVNSGDRLGIHVHPHRWDDNRGYVYSDHTDPTWVTHCIETAAATFERTFDQPVRLGSMGGRYIPEHVVDAFVDVGIRVDTTVDPGLAAIQDDRTFAHHATAPCTDFRGYPRHPYRVSRRGLDTIARSEDDARPLVEIPRSSYDYVTALAPFGARVKTKLRRRGMPMPLLMGEIWPSPSTFWDFVERAADASPLPFVQLVVRTDSADRPSQQRVRAALAALPRHRIAERLQFVDPLLFADLPPGAPKKGSVAWTNALAVAPPQYR